MVLKRATLYTVLHVCTRKCVCLTVQHVQFKYTFFDVSNPRCKNLLTRVSNYDRTNILVKASSPKIVRRLGDVV